MTAEISHTLTTWDRLACAPLVARRIVLQRRYLDACHAYNVTRCAHQPLRTVQEAMQQAQAALEAHDAILGRCHAKEVAR